MAGSTPIYGFPYPEPSDLVANYPALGEELAEDVENVIAALGSGLNLVNATSIANTGGTASKSAKGTVTFTGVTNIALNGCFSSTFENYFVTFTNDDAVLSNGFALRYRVGGVDATAANYMTVGLITNDGSGPTRQVSINQTSHLIADTDALNSSGTCVRLQIFRPFAAVRTRHIRDSLSGYQTSTFGAVMQYMGNHNVAASYDGFTIYNNGGGSFSGTIRVYGYQSN